MLSFKNRAYSDRKTGVTFAEYARADKPRTLCFFKFSEAGCRCAQQMSTGQQRSTQGDHAKTGDFASTERVTMRVCGPSNGCIVSITPVEFLEIGWRKFRRRPLTGFERYLKARASRRGAFVRQQRRIAPRL